jgi:hypothetical protein
MANIPRAYNIIKDVDYVGNDIGYYTSQTVDSCKKMCDSAKNCAGFLYRSDKRCWLKTDKVNNPTAYKGLDFYSSSGFFPPVLNGAVVIPAEPAVSGITWEVTWKEAVGSVIFYVGNKQACHLNIRDSTTVMNTYDMGWGQEIIITQFHSALRPLSFTISFDIARGFSITYQGNVVGTLPNRLNVTDPNSFRIVTTSSKIQVTDVDALRALDNSETEYNRMLTRHMTQHRILMDDLMKLSTESGSGSGSGSASTNLRDILKKQKAEADQAALVKRIGTTMSALNASDQRLMKPAPQFMDETKASDKKTAQLVKSGDQKGAQFIRDIDAYEALIDTINSREGFENASKAGALEVSQLKRESHKYMFAILGVVALYAFYKTLKQIKNVNFK